MTKRMLVVLCALALCVTAAGAYTKDMGSGRVVPVFLRVQDADDPAGTPLYWTEAYVISGVCYVKLTEVVNPRAWGPAWLTGGPIADVQWRGDRVEVVMKSKSNPPKGAG